MTTIKIAVWCMFSLAALSGTYAQDLKLQRGLLYKASINIRLGSIDVLNKRSFVKARSSVFDVFNILALPGDILSFSSRDFQSADFVVTDFADRIIFLEPVTQLKEVVIKEHSLRDDIKEAQRGYREKSVFYTDKPHYYYLVLKPMTFIYENFKSEVIDARRFNKYTRAELDFYKVSARFNDAAIKKVTQLRMKNWKILN